MDQNNNSFLKPLATRMVSFLTDEMGIQLESKELKLVFPGKIELHPYTAMIGVGGSTSFMFVISFESKILEELTKAFVFGDIDAEEMEPMKESVACEVANTIMGNAIPNFPNGGTDVTITPPVMVESGKSISKNSTSMIATTNIVTANGIISMAVIKPDSAFQK